MRITCASAAEQPRKPRRRIAIRPSLLPSSLHVSTRDADVEKAAESRIANIFVRESRTANSVDIRLSGLSGGAAHRTPKQGM